MNQRTDKIDSLQSITLLGSSSGRNAGDASLMSSIMDAVDAECGRELLYEIPTIKPSYVRDNYYTRVKPIGILPWNLSIKMLGLPTLRSVMRTDLTLIFDAILFDRSLYNPLFNFLSTLYLLLPWAHKRGKRIACYNVGVGPVETRMGQNMLRELSELMEFITVRDESSYNILKDVGVQNRHITIAADAALNASVTDERRTAELFREIGIDPTREFLAINVNPYIASWSGGDRRSMGEQEFVDVYAAAVNKFLDRHDVPVVFVCTQHMDIGISQRIMGKLKSKNKLRLFSNRDHNHYDITAVLGKASLLLGMRLHSIILATSGLAPAIGIAYQPKVRHYFEFLNMPENSFDFADFTADKLASFLEKGWRARGEYRAALEKRIPEVKDMSLTGARLVGGIDRGDDLDATS